MTLEMLEKVRLDKWLWAVRICKTRAAAADMCKRQRVSVDGQKAKPSREVAPGQVITVRRDGIDWIYKVIKPIEKRVGAGIAKECREDLTPEEDLERLKSVRKVWVPRRPKGAGRPTKKDRRDMDDFLQ